MKPVYNGSCLVTVSPSANDLPHENIVLYVPPGADITVTVTGKDGVQVAGLVLSPGYHAVSPKKISAVSGGTLYYWHNQDKTIHGA